MKIRWNSTFKTINRLLIYKKLIQHFYETLDSREGINSTQRQTFIKLKFSEVECNVMQVLHRVLERFQVATKLLSGHKYPTLSLAYAVVYSLSHYLNDRSTNSAQTAENKIKDMLLKAFNRYMVRNEDEVAIMCVAAFLDPMTHEVLSADNRRCAESFIILEAIRCIYKLRANALKEKK